MRNVAGLKRRNFARETKGNVAVLFGLAIIPILLAVGVAVDYGSALSVRSRMSDAADAAALAIGSWTDLNDAQLKVKAQQFFDANYPPSSLGTAGKLSVAFVGDDIHVSVTGSVPTTFMKLANIDSVDVGASSVVTQKQRNIELALVLDTTGSMSWSGKMSAMQEAAKKLVQDLFHDQAKSDTVKIAVVPFAGAVNVGADKSNESWIDKNAKSDVSWEDFKPNHPKALDLYDDLKKKKGSWKWAGCVRERDGDAYELTDATPVSGTSASLFAPYLAPDEPDENGYGNSYLEDGGADACKTSGGGWGGWGGGGGDVDDPDECQRDTAKYSNPDLSGGGHGPDWNCPPRAVTPLTDIQGQAVSAIEALKPEGNTVIPAGLLWGWRVLSPNEPFTEGKPYDPEKWVKAIVLLTDGENEVNGGSNEHNESVYNAFGYAAEGHLGNKNGKSAEHSLNSKLSTVCNNVKAQGVLIYTISFQVSDQTTKNLLKNCATQPDMYYNSPSNDQLAGIFKDIAQGLSELRIAQ